MGTKNKIKNLAALVLGLSFAVAGAGCDSFFLTDAEKDMNQTVGNVNIVNYLQDTEYAEFSEQLDSIIREGGITTEISKRDLVAAFLNVGSQYVQNYGYSYRDTFEMLMDNLVSRKLIVQNAILYYLSLKDGKTAADCFDTTKMTAEEKALFEAHPEVWTMKYFLGEDEYQKSVYSLKKAINDSLDSVEKGYITAEDEEHNHGEARTLPTNVKTEKEDYYYKGVYEVYTGRNTPESCGEAYERVEGSTATTRMKAYNTFLANLSGNSLILEGENTSNFTELNYYYVELAGQLEQALITKYSEDLTKAAEDALTYERVREQYVKELETQTEKYAETADFKTALDSVSDTSFVLNSPVANYGFVYNILLPFSALQTEAYAMEKTKGYTQSELYQARAKILDGIVAKDLRGSWISEHDHADYSYQVGEDWYFFEEQTSETKDLEKYEALKQYAGKYAYNGTVDKENDKYTPSKTGRYTDDGVEYVLNIDGFMKEFEAHIKAVSGKGIVDNKKLTTYGENGYLKTGSDKEFDFSKFMYYEGKVDFTDAEKNPANYFVEGTAAYKAVSAVNELMFAYSTDTGCLNTYMGYVVSPFDTDFVDEFEYAAQYAVRELGVGGYVVAPSEYGWHIIYVSYAFNGGNVYADADISKTAMETEGSFFNLYYEALKTSTAQSAQTNVQNKILVEYNNDSCVKLYTDRYEDLLSIGE